MIYLTFNWLVIVVENGVTGCRKLIDYKNNILLNTQVKQQIENHLNKYRLRQKAKNSQNTSKKQ